MNDQLKHPVGNPTSVLMDANALLRTVIDENPNIILMKDWDGKFLLGNRALANLYGTTPQDLVGKDDGDFNPNAEQVAFFLQNVRDVMSQDQTQVVMEESTNAATGETNYYQSIKIPLTAPDGKKQILVIANDVSELKRTQKKLEESERRLRYVLEATGEGLWDWDVVGGMVSHNRRWCQLTGCDEDFMQHPLSDFADLLHEDDKYQVIKKLQACLVEGARYESEHRLRLKNNQIVWVLDRGNVVERAADGSPLRVVGSMVDITERKAAELAAEHSGNLLREAVNSIAQGFTIYDEQDRLYLCNETYKSFYEASRDLIEPGNTFEMIVRQGAERGQYSEAIGNVDAWVKERVEQHQQANGQVREQQLADGRWLLIVESRTPSGFIVGNRLDITAHKAAEVRAREHGEQLKAIFALSPDGFVSFDRAQVVKYVSPAFARMTGLSEAEVQGLGEAAFSRQLARQCLPEATFVGIDALRASSQTGGDNGPRHVIELPHNPGTPEGGRRVLWLSLRESHGQSVSQILHLRDITHETEVERLKSEFLSTAAHELRTPMASIYGFAEVLLKQKVDNTTRQEFLGIIFRQSEVMADILNELLDLARIEARQGKDFVLETITVQNLVDEVVRSFKLPKQRVAPSMHAPAAPLSMLGDRKKSQQAVLNVLSNAYKYSAPDGLVDITIEQCTDTVAIRITDQGIGMTPEQTQRVGERFYRADSSGKVSGTGLGMSIVAEIMALHNGSLQIESLVGQGTCITLQFPLATSL